MIREIKPISSVNATVRVPGSKSITNRALICAALAQGESYIHNASDSDDTALMNNGLNQLGVLVRKQNDALIVYGTGGKLYAPKFPIPTGNAGTTLRFLISLAALAQGKVVFEAVERMAERPISDLLEALRMLGVRAAADERLAHYEVEGGSFSGGHACVSGEKSSQFLSSLLMVAPYAKQDTTVQVEGKLSSSSYVEMTMEVMRRFGVKVEGKGRHEFTVKAGQRYGPAGTIVEPDVSSASYFFAAAAISGGELVVAGLSPQSFQGDIGFVRVLRDMGCEILEVDEGLKVARRGRLIGVDVDMNAMPDAVPTLAVTALFADGPTRIRNVAHLRYKESDRLAALAAELPKLGARVELIDDGIEIIPTSLHGAQLDSHDDHRLAMSFALVGLRVPGVKIENPECVRKSFPTFWEEFEKLY
jgi:3-phosphoshikimate 1-carboxyvinyltransferase